MQFRWWQKLGSDIDKNEKNQYVVHCMYWSVTSVTLPLGSSLVHYIYLCVCLVMKKSALFNRNFGRHLVSGSCLEAITNMHQWQKSQVQCPPLFKDQPLLFFATWCGDVSFFCKENVIFFVGLSVWLYTLKDALVHLFWGKKRRENSEIKGHEEIESQQTTCRRTLASCAYL